MHMFSLILGLVSTLLHVYVSWRIASLSLFSVGKRRQVFWLLSLVVWLIYQAGVQLGHDASSGLMAVLSGFALDWLGALFITTWVLLAVDLFSGFGLWAKAYVQHLRSLALLLAGCLVLFAMLQGHRAPQINRYELALAQLPAELSGLRVVVVSDLHLGARRGPSWWSARVDEVMDTKPDIIVLLGDLFEGHGDPSPELQASFARLQAPMGVFAVTGNHEFHGDSEAAMTMVEAAGIHWLRNRTVQLAPGLALAGVDDLSRYARNGAQAVRIGELLQGHAGEVLILLSHSPLQVEEAAVAGVDVMLSGHTHNGQIWPFHYLVERFYPYMSGRYQVNDMTLIVSRGTGLWGPVMRLWRPGETIGLTLRAGIPAD